MQHRDVRGGRFVQALLSLDGTETDDPLPRARAFGRETWLIFMRDG
jgi:hypothetical protein